MTKEQSVELMTDKMAKFVAYVGKKLPDDVEAKLQELRQQETTPLATAIYDTWRATRSWLMLSPADGYHSL